jgi:hypothetical protein
MSCLLFFPLFFLLICGFSLLFMYVQLKQRFQKQSDVLLLFSFLDFCFGFCNFHLIHTFGFFLMSVQLN